MEKIEECEVCKYYMDEKCKRFPPQIYAEGSSEEIYTNSSFPWVDPGDLCGEFKVVKSIR